MPSSATVHIHHDGVRSNPGTLEMCSDAAVVFFGVWSLIHQLSYFCGLTFVQTWWVAWLGATMSVLLSWRYDVSIHPTTSGHAPRVDWALLAAVVMAVAVTLCLNRPDADDEAYLGFSLIALDNQSLPMRSLSSLNSGYAVTSYDFLRASLSRASGIPLLASYYLVWPAILAGLVVIFQWRLFHLLNIRNQKLALLSLFVVMLFWGDAHRTPSNFGFVRLFQGKGPLVWVVIPAALLYWANVVERRGRQPMLQLFFVIAAGIGFSPSGVTLGVLLLGLFIGATLIGRAFRPDARVIGGLLGILAYTVTIGLVMLFYFDHTSPGVHTEEGLRPFTYTSEMIILVLGDGMRAGIALLCVVALPLTLRASPHRLMLSIYSLMCTCLLLFPWTSQWLAIFGYATMSWRWLYVVPFALGIVVALDRIDDLGKGIAIRLGLTVTALLLFVFVSPKWVVSVANSTTISIPSYKLADPTRLFVHQYGRGAHIEGRWIVSPVTGRWY